MTSNSFMLFCCHVLFCFSGIGNATNKFLDRFEKVENAVIEQGKNVENMTMPELDEVWDSIKHKD